MLVGDVELTRVVDSGKERRRSRLGTWRKEVCDNNSHPSRACLCGGRNVGRLLLPSPFTFEEAPPSRRLC